MKTALNNIIVLLIGLPMIIMSCAKEDSKMEVYDYRQKYFGDFYFTVITEFWMLGQPTTYDTSFYNGVIRKYELSDSEDDL
jgi:hypothetical protein